MDYGKEPFDLKLTLLRMGRQLDVICVITLIGTLLFGGGYYVKNVIFRPEVTYSVTSVYKVEYVVNAEVEISQIYINETTWNTYMHTDAFLDAVQEHLPEGKMTDQELSDCLSARLASDLRMPSTIVTTNQPEKSVEIAGAVEAAMTEHFPEFTREIDGIQVLEAGEQAEEVLLDVRPLRAFVLSAVLSLFFAVVVSLLGELGTDSVWLPAALRKRYGLLTVGTLDSAELEANLEHFFQGKTQIGVCSSEAEVDTKAVAEALQEKKLQGQHQWIPMPTPYLSPESVEKLRELDGVLLVVPSGRHSGKPVEYVLHFLEQQEVTVTAALLARADEALIHSYYRLPGSRV